MSRPHAIPAVGRVLALDWGTSRIGVAISDESQLVASPIATLTRRTGRRLPVGKFLTLVERECPVGLIVGLPLDDDGLEGDSGLAARAMGRTLAARAGLPLDWIDESFSTVEVLQHRRDAGAVLAPAPRAGKRSAAGSIDAAAAAEILQRWLDSRR
ncbi:MAG: Holliday junction resolvase RuvX [Gemmatimonadales bacterium]